MEFSEFVKEVGEKLPHVKNLEVAVSARRDEKGEWALTFKADSIYMTAATGKSPEAVLKKVEAEAMPAAKLDAVGRIADPVPFE